MFNATDVLTMSVLKWIEWCSSVLGGLAIITAFIGWIRTPVEGPWPSEHHIERLKARYDRCEWANAFEQTGRKVPVVWSWESFRRVYYTRHGMVLTFRES